MVYFRYILLTKQTGLADCLDKKIREEEVMSLLPRFWVGEISWVEKISFTELSWAGFGANWREKSNLYS